MKRFSVGLMALFMGLSIALPTLAQDAAEPAPAAATAAAEKAEETLTLDELLERVRSGWREEQKENAARERDFRNARSRQAALLEEAKLALAAEEDRAAFLEQTFEDNEIAIAEHEDLLAQKLGTLGELFGVVRQVAGDTRSQVENSIISSEYPDRLPFLDELGQSKALPSIKSLEGLWATLLEEMIESSQVSRYTAPVVRVSGEEEPMEVIRVGAFNAVGDDQYLKWIPDVQRLGEIGRQPAPKYVDTIADLEDATSGLVRFAIDPARGQILALLVSTPTLRERLDYGGVVGYAIIVLGLATFIFGLIRLGYVVLVSRKVVAQKSSSVPDESNPLGRVLKIYADNKSMDTETLELRLEEQVLKETAKIEGFLWLIKVVSAVAPLMGLLGTVTGMINTFQIITLFGTGDPKMMASGISEALVTTMLGLVVAIPLVLMHSLLASMAKGVTTVLEEQSTGLIATQSEAEGAGRPGVDRA